MSPRPFSQRWFCGLALLLCLFFAAAASAHAQQQEQGILAKVNSGRPANSEAFTFAGGDKSFGTTSAVGAKQANVKTFAFGSKSSVFAGDGKFRSKAFNNPRGDGFRTDAYGTKASLVSQRNSFALGDKTFGTKTMDVREAPAANKTMATRSFVTPTQQFEMVGKRQGALDEIYKNNPTLNIDQVRDLLNKGPAGRP